MIGKTLLRYKITALLGKGGMGEVYRATDTSLDREVAIKVLPETLTHDPERIARFQREARTLASLNHTNIAALYGFENVDGQLFLVMELVEGETLSERIAKGPVPLEEALDIARQIADGLEEAHEKGIVHRDLKPANVKLTPGGDVKILDFGLARAYLGDSVAESAVEHSPTITAAMTHAGIILGTAGYMSPEQAKGKTVDRRADLWSFGVILWEMLTGKRLFEGETSSDTLAAVLRADPPWDELPAETPPAVRRLLERCLERDPRKRLRDIGEARVRLERWRDDPSSLSEILPAATVETRGARLARVAPWWVATVAVLAAAFAWFARPQAPSTADSGRLRLAVELPYDDGLQENTATNVVIAPDGNTLAYIANARLWIRPLDDLEATEVPGTEGITSAAFSPDGRWLAFTAQGKIWRTSVTGGAPFEVCDAPDPRGCVWANDSVLVFSATINGGLSMVSTRDGVPRELTSLDPARNERSHRWPYPLPDGKSVLFMAQFLGNDYDQSDIQVVSLGTKERRTLYRGGASPRFTASGHLLFARKNTVFAVPLDPATGALAGEVTPVLENVWTSVGNQEADDGSAQYDVSRNGTLVYRQGSGAGVQRSRVARLDLTHGAARALGEAGLYATPLLAPNGKTLAVTRAENRQRNVYLVDLETQLEHQLTFTAAASWLGCWSADSRDLYWSRTAENSSYEILRQRADGSTPEELVYLSPKTAYPTSLSPDGRTLLLTMWGDSDLWDVYQYSLAQPDAKPEPLLAGPGAQFFADFSPDGRWLLYGEGPSGESVVYVVPYPPTGARWEVTRGPVGIEVAWAADQASVYVRDASGFLRIPLTIRGGSVRMGRPERLVEERYLRSSTFWASDVAGDGSVAYVLEPTEVTDDAPAPRTVLVTHWFEELRRRAPRAGS